MDKYELSIKEDKIKKHAEKKDYAAAVKIADTIDWSKVKNIKMLTLVSQVYEKAKNYEEAKNVLLFAYERVPMGRRMLYKLTELCVKGGKIEEAESYFEEFQKIAPNDIGKLLLAYQIEAAKGGDPDQLITILELYRKNEFEEKWAYELAWLYHKAGRVKECVQLCNEIILWFSVGTYVDRALNLKMQYEPLTPSEQEKLVNKKKFEARVRAVEREFERREYQGIREDEGEAVERRRKKEQLKEAAMTSEPETEEAFAAEDGAEAVPDPEEIQAAETPVPKEIPAGDKVIPFSAAPPAEEEASAAAERLFFAGEPEETPKAEPLPVRAAGELPKEDDREDPAGGGTGKAFAGELSDMQADLAQAVQEAVKAQEPSAEEQAVPDAGLMGQTREVVKETRKALRQGREAGPDKDSRLLDDMSAALAASAFPEEALQREPWEAPAGEPLPGMPAEGSLEEPALWQDGAGAPEPEALQEEPSEASAGEPLPETPEEEPGAWQDEAGVPEPEVLREESSEAPAGEPLPEMPEEEPSLRQDGAGASEKEALSGAAEEPLQEEPSEDPAVPEEPAQEPAGAGAPLAAGGAPAQEEKAVPGEAEVPEGAEITCVVVEAEPGAGRIPFAVEKLKKTHEVLGSTATQAAKISGAKLSAKGVHNTFGRLAGRDLIVDDASELDSEAAAELTEEMKRPKMSMVLILVDTSERMEEFLLANPELDQLCVYLEEGGQMDIDEFVACADKYAKDEECVIEEMANLAIYAAAERLWNDGTELTEEAAKKLVDGAIDRAEHRGIKGLFGSKYDKEGYLILKEQFFKGL